MLDGLAKQRTQLYLTSLTNASSTSPVDGRVLLEYSTAPPEDSDGCCATTSSQRLLPMLLPGDATMPIDLDGLMATGYGAKAGGLLHVENADSDVEQVFVSGLVSDGTSTDEKVRHGGQRVWRVGVRWG